MEAGWYPDPWTAGSLRWWNGTAWMSFQAPMLTYTTPGPYLPITPQEDIETEQRWARRGRWAFLAIGVADVVSFIFAAPGSVTGALGLGDNLVSVVRLIPGILAAWWLYEVATIARRIGLPARRSPGWAFGFFVPVVNFWFPYQVARDCLPPTHTGRSTVRWWWGLAVSTLVLSVAIALVAEYVGETPALIMGISLCPIPVAAALTGYRMVTHIEASHTELIASRLRGPGY